MVKKNTCIFISGKGSNLKNLIARSRDNSFPIKISLVVSNNKDAYGLMASAPLFSFQFVEILAHGHQRKISSTRPPKNR